MNNGIVGLTPGVGDYAPVTQGSGSWGGNRGRFHSDEFRAFGNRDGQVNWNVIAGASRVVNINPGARSTIGEVVLPGDTGMVFNVGSGFIQLNGVSVPFAAAYNVAGKYFVSPTASANVISAAFENNTVVTNTPGVASALMGMWGVTSTTIYSGDTAACTLPTGLGDFNSNPVIQGVNAGTLTGSFAGFKAQMFCDTGSTLASRVGYAVFDSSSGGGGTITAQYGVDIPLLTFGAANTGIRIGQGGQTIAAAAGVSQFNNGRLIDLLTGTTTLNFANCALPYLVNFSGTISLTQSAQSFGLATLFNVTPTIVNTVGSSANAGPVVGLNYGPTFSANTQTGLGIGTSTGYLFNPNTSVSNAGTITSGAFVGMQTTGTMGTGTTIAAFTGALFSAPTITGTLTTWVGVDIAAVTGAGTNIGIRNASSLRQQGAFIATNNVVTVTSNAGTVAVTNYLSTFTNSSAATMAITMAVTGAVDGQKAIVRIYDFSGVTQTIGWTNTENGGAAVPLTSNGSTTLPITVGFIYNGSTSKWRCLAVA